MPATPKPLTLHSALFGQLVAQPDTLHMIAAIEADDPRAALALMEQGFDPLAPMDASASAGFFSLRSKSALLWAFETPAPNTARALIERLGQRFSQNPDPAMERALLGALHAAASRADLAACEAMERSGWPKPPTLLAAHMLLRLLQSRGKRHRAATIRPVEPDAPRATHAQAFEPIVEWIVRLNNDASLPMGQMPSTCLPVSASSIHQQTTLLMIAGSERVANFLIAQGADMTLADRRGRSALGCALANGNRGWIEALARAGAPLEACMGSLHVGEAGAELRREVAAQWAIDAARAGLESAVPAAAPAACSPSKPRL